MAFDIIAFSSSRMMGNGMSLYWTCHRIKRDSLLENIDTEWGKNLNCFPFYLSWNRFLSRMPEFQKEGQCRGESYGAKCDQMLEASSPIHN